ncbi:hypothetical protein SDC9_142679 [bioreactor metagenome]|uniref:Uncharacterized protein n=1 Tax=bioreactor metagenome TaxID=1076179 RepID=A0A645E164_9ZZZZ
MIIGPAGHDPKALIGECVAQCLGILDDLLLIFCKLRTGGFLKSHRLGGDNVHQRTALHTREHSLVNFFSKGLLAQDKTAPWAAQGFMGRGSDKIRVGYRVLVQSRCHQARNMRHINHHQRIIGLTDL